MGGGAAGFFCAAILAESMPASQIILFERAENVLQKVKVSGGGRCNVTHACFEAAELVKNYPRGNKELRGPFSHFNPQHTVDWFEGKGVPLKTEEDGRMFPVSDSSQSIIDSLWRESILKGVVLKTRCGVNHFSHVNNEWQLETDKGLFYADYLVIASGSSQKFWNLISECTRHTIIPPVASLFTFNSNHLLLQNLSGVSLKQVEIKLINSQFQSTGPLLITHWGLSGPAILKLSAWAAIWLHEKQYQFHCEINWKPGWNKNKAMEWLLLMKKQHPKKKIYNLNPELPQRLWQNLINECMGKEDRNLADMANLQLEKLAQNMTNTLIEVNGKSTFKEEFVSAGGVELSEVDFKTFQSKLHPNLFFIGEVLNVDAVTGGFNFQAAWTGAFLAASAIGKH